MDQELIDKTKELIRLLKTSSRPLENLTNNPSDNYGIYFRDQSARNIKQAIVDLEAMLNQKPDFWPNIDLDYIPF